MEAATLAEIEAIKQLKARAPRRRHRHGSWATMGLVKLGAGFRGYGHCFEEYIERAGRWRIRRLKPTRLEVMPL